MNNNRATNIEKESEENSAILKISIKSHEEEPHVAAHKLCRYPVFNVERLESVENSTSRTLEERKFLSKHHDKFSRLKLHTMWFQEYKEGMLEGSLVCSLSLAIRNLDLRSSWKGQHLKHKTGRELGRFTTVWTVGSVDLGTVCDFIKSAQPARNIFYL